MNNKILITGTVAFDEIEEAAVVEGVVLLPIDLLFACCRVFYYLPEEDDFAGGPGHYGLVVDEVHLPKILRRYLPPGVLRWPLDVDAQHLALPVEDVHFVQ